MNIERIENLIEMAGFGIGYWATDAEWDSDAQTYTIFEDDEDNNPIRHVLSYKNIEEAAEKIINGFSNLPNGGWAANAVYSAWSADDVDAEAADIIIQVACFGEVIYG